tara:strand:+ start:7826 stop:8848 length:1023 start_codon:yes stop_codon:yes gene_type:complete
MDFVISPIKVQELSKISDVSQPVISRKFKEEGSIKSENNRIVGITPSAIQQYLTDKGQGHIYKGGAYLFTNCCGGTGKTTSAISVGTSFRRISNPETSPVVFCDFDSQQSLTSVLYGKPIEEDQPVLVHYLEGKAKLDELLIQVGRKEDNLWLIPSNLSNLYLDRVLASPQLIRTAMKKLILDLFSKFGNQAKIFFDSPPALANTTNSLVCAFSELQQDYDTKLVVPLRSDKFSFSGSKLIITELKSLIEAFNLPDIEKVVFLSSFDKRLKISVDIFKQLLEDPILKEFVSPVVVRHSSEVSRSHQANRSIYNGATTPIGEDFTDLMLFIMGYERTGGTA